MSRILPGKQDCVTVWENGQKETHQKRLLLYSVAEAYQNFIVDHPSFKIGITKFRQSKPKYVKTAGSAGSHKVCVCILCENPKLMLNSIKNYEGMLQSCSEIISEICCDPTSEKCALLNCDTCQMNLLELKRKLLEILEIQEIDVITFHQWLTVDRCELVKIEQDSDEFVDKFIQQIEKLIPHKFIAVEQLKHSASLKSSLKKGEYIVQLDFSENMTFKIQNESQSHYWNRAQATLHVCVIYYLGENNVIEHFSYIIVSDVLKHDSVFVYATIKSLIAELKARFKDVDQITYFSDGAPAHYKNRSTFSILSYHYRNFGVKAKWNFFATAHGKGPCDGLGGTVKRKVYHENLKQDTENQIKNAEEMFKFCVKTWKPTVIKFHLLTSNDILNAFNDVKIRFDKSRPIVGSRSFHSFVPLSIHLMEIKKLSSSEESQLVKI